MNDIVYQAGHDFPGPHGQGYKLTRDVRVDDFISADHFQPYGDAPESTSAEKMPGWLVRQIWPDGLVASEPAE